MHVPYKASALAMTEVIGGQMHATGAAAPVLSVIAGGQKVRALGATIPSHYSKITLRNHRICLQ